MNNAMIAQEQLNKFSLILAEEEKSGRLAEEFVKEMSLTFAAIAAIINEYRNLLEKDVEFIEKLTADRNAINEYCKKMEEFVNVQ